MTNKKDAPIGVFDSGMGGISVLRELVKIMPNEDYIFFGDSANAPYGIKTVEEVQKLSFEKVEHLLSYNCKAIVVACNTATSAAIKELRAAYPDLIIVGLEPALKPAVEHKKDSKVGVMATPLTLKEKKFNDLMNKYITKADIRKIPAPDLVEFIESGDVDSPELETYLQKLLSPYKNSDSIVLGCTHFPFAKKVIQKIMGDDTFIVDGGEGAARETKHLLEKSNLLSDKTEKGSVKFENSRKTKEELELSQKLFNL